MMNSLERFILALPKKHPNYLRTIELGLYKCVHNFFHCSKDNCFPILSNANN